MHLSLQRSYSAFALKFVNASLEYRSIDILFSEALEKRGPNDDGNRNSSSCNDACFETPWWVPANILHVVMSVANQSISHAH